MKKISAIWFLAALMLAVATEACANGGFGLGPAVYGVAASGFLSVRSLGIGMVLAVLIECVIFMCYFKIGFWQAVYFSAVINIVSAIVGIFVGFTTFTFLFPVAIVWMIALGYWWNIESDFIPVWVKIGFPTLFIIGFICQAIGTLHGESILVTAYNGLVYPLPVIMGFALSVFIEGLSGKKIVEHEHYWKGILWGNITTYVLIFIITAFMGYSSNWYPIMDSGGPAYQSRAKGTLRSIGSSQLAYQGTNETKSFGSFSALQEDLYIAEGYDLENMIEGYTMTWEVSGVLSTVEDDIPIGIMNRFTIVAYPDKRGPAWLLTFGVTEDQVVRVYNPNSGNDPDNIYSWDPIL